MEQGSVDASLAKEMERDFRALLQDRLNKSKVDESFSEVNPVFSGAWKGLRLAKPADMVAEYDTSVPEKTFVKLAKAITTLPQDKNSSVRLKNSLKNGKKWLKHKLSTGQWAN